MKIWFFSQKPQHIIRCQPVPHMLSPRNWVEAQQLPPTHTHTDLLNCAEKHSEWWRGFLCSSVLQPPEKKQSSEYASTLYCDSEDSMLAFVLRSLWEKCGSLAERICLQNTSKAVFRQKALLFCEKASAAPQALCTNGPHPWSSWTSGVAVLLQPSPFGQSLQA